MWTTNSCFSIAKLLTSAALFLSYQASLAVAEPIELYGINYNTRQGADWNPWKCKARYQVFNDLALLQRVTSRIRVLSLTDCGQGELVLNVAKELGLKLWLGLWTSFDDEVFQQEKAALESMFERNLIDANTVIGITVGSESIYRGEVEVDEIIGYRDEVKELAAKSGLPDLPVSIVDIAQTYQEDPSLTQAVDVIMLNIFPFWSAIEINESINYILEEVGKVTSHIYAQGKELILGETGWPSDGFIPGVGTASPELQQQFFIEFFCQVDKGLGWKYYWFTGINNKWRQEQDEKNTIEGTWGFLYANLTLKPNFEDLQFSCPGSEVVYDFAETDWTIPSYTAAPATPAPTGPEHCSVHSECNDLGLLGDCCPAPNGLYLGCCDQGSAPTKMPTATPTKTPTGAPSKSPTLFPTTAAPTMTPTTHSPTTTLTSAPSTSPTNVPSIVPSIVPSAGPTLQPITTSPTDQPPTDSPTTPMPTPEPTEAPSVKPSMAPSKEDSITPPPTSSPSFSPSISPTKDPGQIDGSNQDETSSTHKLYYGGNQVPLVLITFPLVILNLL